MKCPHCGFGRTKVLDTRVSKDALTIRRRRECEKCKERFTTYEKAQKNPMVVKKDGSKEEYKREKLKKGIEKACKKRLSGDEILKIVDEIEDKVLSSSKPFKTSKIGKLVLNELKNLDEISYLRFTSVYQNFKDVKSFEKEVKSLLKK